MAVSKETEVWYDEGTAGLLKKVIIIPEIVLMNL
jgi:hypothetical protein